MFSLLRNYIREQKNNWLQVFGLGFLVIIMVTTFLSLNFAINFLTNQYNNDIAKGQYHQNIAFETLDDDSRGFWTIPYGTKDNETWLENLDYYQKADTIDDIKLANATFQLRHAEGYKAKEHKYLYRFIYNAFDDDTTHIAVGRNFAKKVKNNWIEFKLSLPLNYPSLQEHDKYLDEIASIFESYVYNKNTLQNLQNRVNFFITSPIALAEYNKLKTSGQLPYATRDYQEQDIFNQLQLYKELIMGMLYGDNISWRRVSLLSDFIMTGKTLAFIQITPNDKIDLPILVKNGGVSLSDQPLKDDEILIYSDFAAKNNLKVGSEYVFSGHKFIIRGFATSAITAAKTRYFRSVDDKNQSIAFITQNTFDKISADPYTKVNTSDFILYNPDTASKNIDQTIDNSWLYSYFHELAQKKLASGTLIGQYSKPLPNLIDASGFMRPLVYYQSYSGTFEDISVLQLASLKSIFNQISSVFLTLIFIVTAVIIFIIIFKMIDRNKKLIGILKANGYPSWKLNIVLICSIIIPLILFSIIGAVIAVIASKFIISGFSATFALIEINFSFYLLPTLLVIILPIIMLLFISFLLVAFLLKASPLTLINNNWSKNKYSFSIGFIFSFVTRFVIKNFSYRNKLVITNAFRSFGKLSLVIIVSLFASTLVLFALASNGLINNMLGLQFASINYNYQSEYTFDNNNSILENFINNDNQLLYKKEEVNTIKSKSSLYIPLRQALMELINNPSAHPIIDARYGYIMGSELLKIRKEIIEPNLSRFPIEFQKMWHDNQYFIDYLTNNGRSDGVDLMVNFGLLAYNKNQENSYTRFNFNRANSIDINDFDSKNIYYDNVTNTLVGKWYEKWAARRSSYGVNQNSSDYLTPNFKVTNFSKFANLNLENMKISTWWQDQNFLNVREQIITKLGIKNPDTAAVQVVPMIGSTAPTVRNVGNGGDGNSLNKIVIYPYQGLDKQTKYIFGVIYDGARSLQQNIILMPEKWINQIIIGHNTDADLFSNFANAKFSKLSTNELRNYLPIISSNNDYKLDVSQLGNNSYLKSKGIIAGLESLYDINSIKEIVIAQQYTFQVLLLFFGIFLVLLTLMIITIISNINIRDNLILINILKSLGYSFFEISYIFLIVTIPLLIICAILSVYIAPFLTAILADSLSRFTSIYFPVVFKWWYFALSFLVIILIYIISYLITWKLNVSHKDLTTLTK